MIKDLPATQKDLLENEMATHPSILAWRSPMDRGTWRVAAHHKESDTTEGLNYSQGSDLKGITLSHSYRDKKWQNRQNLLSCQGLKGTL